MQLDLSVLKFYILLSRVGNSHAGIFTRVIEHITFLSLS